MIHSISTQKKWFSRAKTTFFLVLFPFIMFSTSAYPMECDQSRELVQDIVNLANQGDEEAMFSLAIMYDEGKLLPRDRDKATYWLTQAARRNLPVACLYLGMRYAFGTGVDVDKKRAAALYEQAAESGWANAQFLLGTLLMEDGPTKNMDKAEKWLEKAARQGYPGALEQLGLLRKITP